MSKLPPHALRDEPIKITEGQLSALIKYIKEYKGEDLSPEELKLIDEYVEELEGMDLEEAEFIIKELMGMTGLVEIDEFEERDPENAHSIVYRIPEGEDVNEYLNERSAKRKSLIRIVLEMLKLV